MDEFFGDLVKKADYDTKLAITAWVFKHIIDHAQGGGSFRYLIYDRLGFNEDAYVPLYEAGGMHISNEFDLNLKDRLIEHITENKIESMKKFVRLCDEPDCFKHADCGWPSEDKYRWTCSTHSNFDKR